MIPFPKTEIEGTVGARFDKVARHQPGLVAIADGDTEWTYGEVLKRTELYRVQLSRLPSNKPVALVFGHGPEAIIAMFGAIRAGVPVIPVDPNAPPEDLAGSIAVCQLVLTEPEFHDWCKDNVGAIPVASGIAGLEKLEGVVAVGTLATPSPASHCIIFLTSGTTGVAKRTIRTHRSICRHIWQLPNHHDYSPKDRQAHISSFAFGGSVPVVLGGLLTGGTIDIFKLRKTNATVLADALAERGITILQLTPSLMRELTDILSQSRGDWQPRLIVVGGEKLYAGDLFALRDILGWTCPVVHRLASSECGVIAEWAVDLDAIDPNSFVPVGYPVENRDITIIGDDGQQVATDEVGEIVISGDYMSSGYWGRTDLTKKKFSPDATIEQPLRQRFVTGDLGSLHANGLLNYFGRKDSMTKIRGYRVELSAVENAIRAVDGVSNAAVLVKKNRRNSDYLLGYAQRALGANATAISLRAAVQRQLPEFMVPRRIIVMDEFPLTAGGKVAVNKLPDLDRNRPEGLSKHQPVAAPTETMLAAIWSNVLEIDEISRDDDFFELGGDSLEALQVAMLLQKKIGKPFDETDLFLATTLQGMAKIVEDLISALHVD